MALTGYTQWKEQLFIRNEDGKEFLFDCGWGVEPPVAYLPAASDWRRCTPSWLHKQRQEVIAVMQHHGHRVEDGPYPDHVD